MGEPYYNRQHPYNAMILCQLYISGAKKSNDSPGEETGCQKNPLGFCVNPIQHPYVDIPRSIC